MYFMFSDSSLIKILAEGCWFCNYVRYVFRFSLIKILVRGMLVVSQQCIYVCWKFLIKILVWDEFCNDMSGIFLRHLSTRYRFVGCEFCN